MFSFPGIDEGFLEERLYGFGAISTSVGRQLSTPPSHEPVSMSSSGPCRYVCSNQGSRAEDKKFSVCKRNRAHTRTGCRVRMGITLERGNGIYIVHDLFVEHNHILHTAQTSYKMVAQNERNLGLKNL